MECIISILICSLVIASVMALHYRKKSLAVQRNEMKESQIIRPQVLRPTFQIVYSKDELTQDDIDVLADYVLNFNSLIDGENREGQKENREENNYAFVKLNDINFHKLKNIHV